MILDRILSVGIVLLVLEPLLLNNKNRNNSQVQQNSDQTMGLFKEGLFAFRGRRFVEWIFTERPQIPLLFGLTFYSLIYLQYKYDWITRWKGEIPYDN